MGEVEERILQRDLNQLKRDVKCLHDSFEKFEGKYSPHLEKIMENHLYWSRVREQVIIGTAKGFVWAMLSGFVVAVGYAARDYIINIVAHGSAKPPMNS